jgi:hypothetical protein
MRVTNVLNWASDTTKGDNICNKNGVASLPWPEDEIKKADAEPIFSVFQGACPQSP